MSLLTNSRNYLVNRSSVEPLVVPSASVWDVEGGDRRPTRGEVNSRYVRTLRVEPRTTCRSNRVVGMGPEKPAREIHGDIHKSNTGNYALGAVFGIAVFLGTLLGGLAGSEEDGAPQQPVSEVRQVEAAVSG